MQLTDIYDCFLFDGEYDLLRLRLKLHAPYVSFFVIVQSSLTFQGNYSSTPKLDIDKIELMLPEVKGKIKYTYLDSSVFDCCSNAVEREILSRQHFSKSLASARSHDFIIISDLDELFDFRSINFSAFNPDFLYKLCLLFCYFSPYYVCQNMPWWKAPIAFSGQIYRQHRLVIGTLRPVANHLSSLPSSIPLKYIYGCGIHMSFLGGYQEVHRKLSRYTDRPSFSCLSISEFNGLIRNGRDVFGRSLIWRVNMDIKELFADDFCAGISSLPVLEVPRCLSSLPCFSGYLAILAQIDSHCASIVVTKAYCFILFSYELVLGLLSRR